MKKGLAFVVMVLLIMVCFGTVTLAAEYPIDYVLKNFASLANKTVTVRGVVANSQAVTPGPLSRIKGEYDLTDESGATIHVQTTSNPPPNGVERRVIATVDISGATPVLMEKNSLMPWVLYAILAVLVILGVILIVLLFKKPTPAPSVIQSPVSVSSAGISGPPIVEPARTAASAKPTVALPEERVKTSQKPTVQISTEPKEQPLADLTVIEGEGAKYGTKFSLKKEKQKIGRREDMDIRLTDETVSREHASIWWQDGSFYIQDEASSSGTLVNGQRITRQSLSDNDEIQVGKTKLVFRVIRG